MIRVLFPKEQLKNHNVNFKHPMDIHETKKHIAIKRNSNLAKKEMKTKFIVHSTTLISTSGIIPIYSINVTLLNEINFQSLRVL